MLHIQFIKYAIVGLISNGLLYFVYLLITAYGLGHKTAMTLLYVLGVLQTFIFNKKWTFANHGAISTSFFRYCLSYALGYLVNLLALYYFVDNLSFPHEIVQGIMILFNAVMLFLLQKFWVFSVGIKKSSTVKLQKKKTKSSNDKRRNNKSYPAQHR